MLRHWILLSARRCPSAFAIVMPISPETRKRSASEVSGGASATIIRAEVKADDHISANASPIRIDFRSI